MMNHITDATTLVIVGQWNPAVLQPPWLAKYAFDLEAHDVPVDVEMVLNGPIRLTMQNVCIVPAKSKLMLSPAPFSVEGLALVQSVGVRILTALPHTPVAAIGLNFRMEMEGLDSKALSVFDDAIKDLVELSNSVEVLERSTTAALQIDGRRLNLSRKLSDGKLTMEFNFHHDVQDASEAATFLATGNVFAQNFALARQIASELYGEAASEPAGRPAVAPDPAPLAR